MSAQGLLAKGWFRGRRAGWVGTGAVLAAALTLLVIVSAVFGGMQAETEDRVADAFTGELRITPVGPGVFTGGLFTDAEAAIEELGGRATPRMEAQSVLSRRGFIEAIVGEDDQFTFTNPGSTGDKDTVALGVLIGVPFTESAAAAPYENHVLRGELPSAWDGEGRVPIAMSLRSLENFLTAEERDGLSAWPPREADLDRLGSALQFEITSAVLTNDTETRDVIRERARVVAIFETGVDQLDSLTVWAPIGAARHLMGHGIHEPVANVIAVHGNAEQASSVADANGWATEDRTSFTARYLGQLVVVLQTLSTATAIVLFTVPAFLVAHGLERVLEEHKREVAVLRAVGMPGRMVKGALARLVAGMAITSILVAAALVALSMVALHAFLPNWDAAPLPLDVRLGWETIVGAVGVAVGSIVVAFLIAARSQKKVVLSAALRAF